MSSSLQRTVGLFLGGLLASLFVLKTIGPTSDPNPSDTSFQSIHFGQSQATTGFPNPPQFDPEDEPKDLFTRRQRYGRKHDNMVNHVYKRHGQANTNGAKSQYFPEYGTKDQITNIAREVYYKGTWKWNQARNCWQVTMRFNQPLGTANRFNKATQSIESALSNTVEMRVGQDLYPLTHFLIFP
ncbi:MAG: hypothetical protein AAFQ37_14145 [Bacteroidota bacterium]